MSDFDKLRSDVEEVVQEFIQTKCSPFQGDTMSKMGLDERAFSRHDAYFNDEVLVIPTSERRTADYYGGLEYVDKDYVFEMGGYVFYSAEDDRIADHLSRVENDNEVFNAYEGGVCPNCGEGVPRNVGEGDECENCGHIFTAWANKEETQQG